MNEKMKIKNHIKFLRISYWAGVIFDALVIIPMLSPKIGGEVFGMKNFSPGNDYEYAMKIASSLMIGWVFLLLWADRKPIERKGVLFLTVFPVLAGLIISGLSAVNSDFISISNMLPTFLLQGLLVILFVFSYFNAAGKF